MLLASGKTRHDSPVTRDGRRTIVRLVRTARRTKVLGAIAGLLVGGVGLGLLLTHAAQTAGTVLTVVGLGFAGTMLASLWTYKSQD